MYYRLMREGEHVGWNITLKVSHWSLATKGAKLAVCEGSGTLQEEGETWTQTLKCTKVWCMYGMVNKLVLSGVLGSLAKIDEK